MGCGNVSLSNTAESVSLAKTKEDSSVSVLTQSLTSATVVMHLIVGVFFFLIRAIYFIQVLQLAACGLKQLPNAAFGSAAKCQTLCMTLAHSVAKLRRGMRRT